MDQEQLMKAIMERLSQDNDLKQKVLGANIQECIALLEQNGVSGLSEEEVGNMLSQIKHTIGE